MHFPMKIQKNCKNSITCASFRTLFDTVISEFPATRSRLAEYARIIHNNALERTLVKLKNGDVSSLTQNEDSEFYGIEIIPESPESIASYIMIAWLNVVRKYVALHGILESNIQIRSYYSTYI